VALEVHDHPDYPKVCSDLIAAMGRKVAVFGVERGGTVFISTHPPKTPEEKAVARDVERCLARFYKLKMDVQDANEVAERLGG
jgi:hypothetical protein